MKNEYYGGQTAILDYLRPAATRMIPLVELPESLNPYLVSHGIHIDIKLMNTLPLGNVKSLPAWKMLEDGDVSGKEVVEASSGNTVFSLGLLAPLYGATSTRAIASPDVSEGKLALLRLAGVEVELVKGSICPDPNDPDGAIAIARRAGGEAGKVNLGQYDNDTNPAAHEQITGPQLHKQLGNTIGLFCAGLGTTGTLLGVSRYLQHRLSGLRVGGVVRAANNLVPGVRTINGLSEVSFEWRDVLTEPLVEVGEHESYEASLALIRAGLPVGPSAGFAYAGLLRHLKRLVQTGEIEQLRGKHAVFIAPDSPFPYLDDYMRLLGEKPFPAVKNNHLRKARHGEVFVMTPEMSVDRVYADGSIMIIDVREPAEFDEYHIEGSENVPLANLPFWLRGRHDNERVVFVCRSGNRSNRATHLARLMNLDAYNMMGGMVEWSAKGLTRTTSPYCAPREELSL